MRIRLALDRASPDELQDCPKQALHKAGAAQLMTPELVATLCAHARGQPARPDEHRRRAARCCSK
jgi:general secretion pathway protein A